MATNSWANGVDKRTWSDRRVGGERRTVTHVDDGEVWGPIEKLGEILVVAAAIDTEDFRRFLTDDEQRRLHNYATRLRIAIGAPPEPYVRPVLECA